MRQHCLSYLLILDRGRAKHKRGKYFVTEAATPRCPVRVHPQPSLSPPDITTPSQRQQQKILRYSCLVHLVDPLLVLPMLPKPAWAEPHERTGADAHQCERAMTYISSAYHCLVMLSAAVTIRKHCHYPLFLVLDHDAPESVTKAFRRRFSKDSLAADLERDAYQQGRLRLHHLPP